MLGDLAGRYAVSQTECSDSAAFTTVGRSKDGNSIRFVSAFLNCSVRIVTGLMEPHLFAGVSGGPKGILPGLASMETIIGNHSPAHLLHPKATYGITHGNPLWEEIHEAALLAKPTFLVNVTVNKNKEITAVFAGDMDAAFERGRTVCARDGDGGCAAAVRCRGDHQQRLPARPQLLPDDQGADRRRAAGQAGRGDHRRRRVLGWHPHGSRMESILRQVKTPEEIIKGIEDGRYAGMDQWQLLLYAQILQKATVYLKTSYLSADDVRACLAVPCDDVSATLRTLLDRYGPGSTAPAPAGRAADGAVCDPCLVAGRPVTEPRRLEHIGGLRLCPLSDEPGRMRLYSCIR